MSGEIPSRRLPGAFSQFWVIFERRWRLFFREKSQVVLQLSLLFVFPCLVVLFAYQGLPQIQNPEMMLRRDVIKELQEMVQFTIQSSQVGGLVSGLIMFQVILLTLMGSNNSAREVVAERLIFEKEKLAGLRPASYVMAKVAFLAILVAAQSAWMCIFVKVICGFPGDILLQLTFLFLANAAVTSICLGVSCWARTTEQASLISIYLVGFQLPLSGVILALPEPLGALIRPTIAAYWSWSGMLQTMKDTRFYDLVVSITLTPVSTISQSLLVLLAQVVLGLALAFAGASRRRWE